MMEEPKRICTSNNYDSVVVVDRISALPNCILGDILSFLTTKQAVSTSLLSKSWKFSWLDVFNLDFNPTHDAENMAFIRFVNRVLLLTAAKPLHKFRLGWADGISLSHVICWIDAAILRKVGEMYLYYLDDDDTFFKLSISRFNCDSLRSLQVQNISFVYHDTTNVCLPRLETLELVDVRFTSEEAFEKLINGCPMLHYLSLDVYEEDPDLDDDDDAEEDFMYIVSSPSLKHISMYIRDRCKLKLKTPSLECLKLYGCILEIFIDKSLSSLVEGDFSIEMDGLEHVKFRTLSTPGVMRMSPLLAQKHQPCVGFVYAFAPATACLSTKFKRLVKLVVRTDCLCYVQDLVNKSENLEELEIHQSHYDILHGHSVSRWTTAPAVVPRCLSKSLKKVRLAGYNGLEDEREMIRFVLKHGIALEVVQIRYKNQGEDGEKLLKEICEFPRKSPACQVSTWEW